jgi:hypothetical protein
MNIDEVELDIAIYNATPSISMPKAIVIRKAVVAYLAKATPPAPARTAMSEREKEYYAAATPPSPDRLDRARNDVTYFADRVKELAAENKRLTEALKLAMPYINAWDMPADDFSKVSRAMLPEGVSHDQQEPDDPSKS